MFLVSNFLVHSYSNFFQKQNAPLPLLLESGLVAASTAHDGTRAKVCAKVVCVYNVEQPKGCFALCQLAMAPRGHSGITGVQELPQLCPRLSRQCPL